MLPSYQPVKFALLSIALFFSSYAFFLFAYFWSRGFITLPLPTQDQITWAQLTFFTVAFVRDYNLILPVKTRDDVAQFVVHVLLVYSMCYFIRILVYVAMEGTGDIPLFDQVQVLNFVMLAESFNLYFLIVQNRR